MSKANDLLLMLELRTHGEPTLVVLQPEDWDRIRLDLMTSDVVRFDNIRGVPVACARVWRSFVIYSNHVEPDIIQYL